MGDLLLPTTSVMKPAPDAVLQLVKCECKTGKCEQGTNCSCRANKMACTDLCECEVCDKEDLPLQEVNLGDDDEVINDDDDDDDTIQIIFMHV